MEHYGEEEEVEFLGEGETIGRNPRFLRREVTPLSDSWRLFKTNKQNAFIAADGVIEYLMENEEIAVNEIRFEVDEDPNVPYEFMYAVHMRYEDYRKYYRWGEVLSRNYGIVIRGEPEERAFLVRSDMIPLFI